MSIDEEIRGRARRAVGSIAEACPALVEESNTDAGNGRRLVALHGDSFRHCRPWGRDLVWDGKRFKPDDTGQIERWAKDTAKQMLAASVSLESADDRAALAKWAVRSESASKLRAMMDLSRSEPGVPVLPDQLDADPYLLNVENGTLDLRTKTFREHDPADLITKVAGTYWDPDAEAPRFLQFLHEVLDGDTELVTFVQLLFGYTLTGSTEEQVLAFLYGTGANGKSTLLNLWLELLGDYGLQADPELLLASYGSKHPTGVADLKGARLAVTSEVGQGRRMDEVQVKQLTGSDRIKARFMRQDFFEFEPEFKLVIAANHKPIIRGTDHAIWRRIRLVPFNVTIPEEKRDPELPAKLREELPGILAWAVEGCMAWRWNGLGEPEAVRAATQEYRSEMDVMGDFLEEQTTRGPGMEVASSDLYKAYRSWCDDTGEKALSHNAFGREMTDRGFERGKDADTRRTTYLGLSLAKGIERVSGNSGINGYAERYAG